MKTPYYKGVPKELNANLIWRAEVLERAAHDGQYAATIRQMCSEDILFYINVMCWIKEPRDTKMPLQPFITYDFQDDAILEFCDGIEQGFSIAWAKSRTMGASWMAVTVFEWFWHFRNNLDFGMVSRKEELVDAIGDPKSLFGKIDCLHQNQPKWLKPNIKRRHRHLTNLDTNSTITGETTTGNIYRGGRLTALIVDEFAAFDVADSFKTLESVYDVSDCKLYNSTAQGANNAFYKIIHESAVVKRYLHFSQHPIYSKGLYTTENGKVKLLDNNFKGTVKAIRIDWEGIKEFKFPEEYPFILDGKTRSPWYDNKEAETGSKKLMAQEVDINFFGSDWQFFDPEFINKLKAEYCIPPIEEGRINIEGIEDNDIKPGDFQRSEGGPLNLWFDIEKNNGRDYIRGREFGVGADVSAGTGASNSCAVVVDKQTGKKVALWKDPNTYPKNFAEICVALCKWFNNAKLVWDASGSIGQTFSKRIASLEYPHLYYHKDETNPGKRVSDKPGYFLNPSARGDLLRDYRSALSTREFINVSASGMDEALQFIEEPGGQAVHSAAKNSQDPSGAREGHGDECIADALASMLRSISIRRRDEKEENIELNPYCLAARLAEWEREQEEALQLEYW